MDYSALKTAGLVAGLGGLALGVFLLLFRRIRLPVGSQRHLTLYMWLVWSVAILGMVVYATGASRASKSDGVPPFPRVSALIQTPIRDASWNVIGRADKGAEYHFTGRIVNSPTNNQYYEIQLGADPTKLALIWTQETEIHQAPH